MTYGTERTGTHSDDAVSPVVGVMLMLAVVLIVAAVVSGFAGGLVGNTNQNAPSLTMDVKVINMGSWTGSGFYATVTSVSDPIPTEDLKIVTSWTAVNGSSQISGGNTVLSKIGNTHYLYVVWSSANYDGVATGNPVRDLSYKGYLGGTGWISPWGTGPGVNGSSTIGYIDTNPTSYDGIGQQFGFYTLVPGTTITAKPCGQKLPRSIGGSAGSGDSGSSLYGYGVQTPYQYSYGSGITYPVPDATTALFGTGWENLREGDKVNIKVIHSPTGKVIFNKDVRVTEG